MKKSFCMSMNDITMMVIDIRPTAAYKVENDDDEMEWQMQWIDWKAFS